MSVTDQERRWLYRVVDFDTKGNGMQSISIVEVWHVGDRPICCRGEAIELCHWRGKLRTAVDIQARLARQVELCSQAVALPLLRVTELRAVHFDDHPRLEEQLEEYL